MCCSYMRCYHWRSWGAGIQSLTALFFKFHVSVVISKYQVKKIVWSLFFITKSDNLKLLLFQSYLSLPSTKFTNQINLFSFLSGFRPSFSSFFPSFPSFLPPLLPSSVPFPSLLNISEADLFFFSAPLFVTPLKWMPALTGHLHLILNPTSEKPKIFHFTPLPAPTPGDLRPGL